MKRGIFALCLALLIVTVFPALGEETPALTPYELPAAIQAALRVDESGFLAPGEAPYTYASRDEGLWLYVTQDLRIEIHRKADTKKPLVWFESYVSCRGEEALKTYMTGSGKSESHFKSPDVVAREAGFVFATSDDFFGYRVLNNYNVGTIVRNGVIQSDKQVAPNPERFPAMDILAIQPDGSLKTYPSNGATAQGLLNEGIQDVFCFGPILVHEGEIDARVKKNSGSYGDLEPRHAIGSIAPNRYLFLNTLGRRTDSKGAGLKWMAEKMQELGVQEAFNLDGGNSLSLVFMGDIINRAPGNTNNRPITSVLGFGTME